MLNFGGLNSYSITYSLTDDEHGDGDDAGPVAFSNLPQVGVSVK